MTCKRRAQIQMSAVKKVVIKKEEESTNQQEKKKRIAVYARVSTNHEEQKQSLQNQKQNITEQIKERDDLILEGMYVDEGITGTKAEIRPQFQELISRAEHGYIDYIVCKNLSRFSRNLADSVHYTKHLKEQGVGIYFIEEGLDTLKPGSDFVLSVLSCVAEQESKNTSAHIRNTFNNNIKKGIKVNGSSPFGYDCIRKEDGTRVLQPNQDAEVVQYIFKSYLEGKSTLQIAEELKKQGIEKRATTISKILHNEAYTGVLRQGKQETIGVRGKRIPAREAVYEVDGAHPAIVSKEDFEKVQSIMVKGQGILKPKTVLTGKVVCGRCGCTYTKKQSRGRTSWVCSSKSKNVVCEGIVYKEIWEEVLYKNIKRAIYLFSADCRINPNHYKESQHTLIQKIQSSRIDEVIKNSVVQIKIGTAEKDRVIFLQFAEGLTITILSEEEDHHYDQFTATISAN